jgi:hypothetical protein
MDNWISSDESGTLKQYRSISTLGRLTKIEREITDPHLVDTLLTGDVNDEPEVATNEEQRARASPSKMGFGKKQGGTPDPPSFHALSEVGSKEQVCLDRCLHLAALAPLHSLTLSCRSCIRSRVL